MNASTAGIGMMATLVLMSCTHHKSTPDGGGVVPPAVFINPPGIGPKITLGLNASEMVAGVPLIYSVDIFHPDGSAAQLLGQTLAPIVIAATTGSWAQFVTLVVRDQTGNVQPWPLHVVQTPGSTLSLDGNNSGTLMFSECSKEELDEAIKAIRHSEPVDGKMPAKDREEIRGFQANLYDYVSGVAGQCSCSRTFWGSANSSVEVWRRRTDRASDRRSRRIPPLAVLLEKGSRGHPAARKPPRGLRHRAAQRLLQFSHPFTGHSYQEWACRNLSTWVRRRLDDFSVPPPVSVGAC